MSQQWFIVQSDDEDGPHTSSQLKSLADSGFLTPQMEVREANRTKSIPAGKLRGLFADEVTADLTRKMPSASSHPLQEGIAILPDDTAASFRESLLPDTGAHVSPIELPASQTKVSNPQSGRIASDRIRINEIRQSLTQKLLIGGPDLPECPSVKATCDELNRLRTEVANFDNRLDRLEAARVRIEQLERDYDKAKKDFETRGGKLVEFHKLLGTLVYGEVLLGNLAEQSACEPRSQLEKRITALVKDRDVLASKPDGGLIQSVKVKSRQLAIFAQLMLEKSRINGAERQIGKRLIDSQLEDSVRCERTERLIGEIQQLRKEIQQAAGKRDEAKQNLIQQRLTTAEELDLKKFHTGTQFNDQVREIRNQRTQAQRFFDQYTNDIPDRLKADDQLPAGTLADDVSELQRLELIVGPKWELMTISNALKKVMSIATVPKSLRIAGATLILCLLLYAGLSFVGSVFRGQTPVNTDMVKNDANESTSITAEMKRVAVVVDNADSHQLQLQKVNLEHFIKPKWDKRFFRGEETLRVTELPKFGPLRMGMHLDEIPSWLTVLRGEPTDVRFEPEVVLATNQGTLPEGVFPEYVDSVIAVFAGEILYKVVYKISLAYSNVSRSNLNRLGLRNNGTKAECLELERQVKADVATEFAPSIQPFEDLMFFSFVEGRRLSSAEIEQVGMALLFSGALSAMCVVQVDGGLKAPMVYENRRDKDDVYSELFRSQTLFVAVRGTEWETIGDSDSLDGAIEVRQITVDHVWIPFIEFYGTNYCIKKANELRKKWNDLPQ